MKSPKDMRIIQIDITNACMHTCSNCTRMCGHHKKNFFMDFETFKRAADSLEGYEGTVGIMGGEPTLHPDFERMVEYLASKYPQKKNNHLIAPQLNFMDGIHDLELDSSSVVKKCGKPEKIVNGPGLWSAIGERYKKYYEIIQDNILFQNLDDHSNEMCHQPALITRKELHIPDEEWFALRDNCWIQNVWSATVTPKGAFFCEVAGALDMLLDGPGGWRIEKDWWRRTPDEFADQLHWCELCGLACNTYARDAREEVDDISPWWYDRLKKLGSPKVKNNKVNVIKISENGEIAEESKASLELTGGAMRYAKDYNSRLNDEKNGLKYKELGGLFICADEEELRAAAENAGKLKAAVIYAENGMADRAREICGELRVVDARDITFGQILYQCLYGKTVSEYLFVTSGNVRFTDRLLDTLNGAVLNPGALLHTELSGQENAYFTYGGKAEVTLLNGSARSIRKLGWDGILRTDSISDLRAAWAADKVIELDESMCRIAPKMEIKPGMRYVLYGAGDALTDALRKISESGAIIAAVVDSASCKWGSCLEGQTVQKPDDILPEYDRYDYVLISSHYYYKEIKKTLMEKGIAEDKLRLL